MAALCHARTAALAAGAQSIGGVSAAFASPRFHEVALRLPAPATEVLERLTAQGILGGADLGNWYPELGNAVLVCATETKTGQDIHHYVEALRSAIGWIGDGP